MKRYIAFYYPIHKPSGGMNDSIGSFRNLRDAIDSCKFAIGQCEWDNDWTYHEAHVWDSETDQVAWAADDDLA